MRLGTVWRNGQDRRTILFGVGTSLAATGLGYLGNMAGLIISLAVGLCVLACYLALQVWMPRFLVCLVYPHLKGLFELLDEKKFELAREPGALSRVHLRRRQKKPEPNPSGESADLSRRESASQEAESDPDPTYNYFISEGLMLDRFLGFFIPPLDFFHGIELKDGMMQFDPRWAKYLIRLPSHLKDPALDLNGQPTAARIVFFDQPILLFYIFESAWVHSAARFKNGKFDELREEEKTPAVKSARAMLGYAYEMAIIYRLLKGEKIACRYVAKTAVRANQYCDFGIFGVGGIDVLYNPVHFKNSQKRIAEERIYVGCSFIQRRAISKFEKDFMELWKTADFWEIENLNIATTRPRLDFAHSECYRSEFLGAKLFEEIYVKQIEEKLMEEGVNCEEQSRNVKERAAT